jgi:hypothetical protein
MAFPFDFSNISFPFSQDTSENSQLKEFSNDGAFSEAAPKEASARLPEAGLPKDAGPCVDDPMAWEVLCQYPTVTLQNE